MRQYRRILEHLQWRQVVHSSAHPHRQVHRVWVAMVHRAAIETFWTVHCMYTHGNACKKMHESVGFMLLLHFIFRPI